MVGQILEIKGQVDNAQGEIVISFQQEQDGSWVTQDQLVLDESTRDFSFEKALEEVGTISYRLGISTSLDSEPTVFQPTQTLEVISLQEAVSDYLELGLSLELTSDPEAEIFMAGDELEVGFSAAWAEDWSIPGELTLKLQTEIDEQEIFAGSAESAEIPFTIPELAKISETGVLAAEVTFGEASNSTEVNLSIANPKLAFIQLAERLNSASSAEQMQIMREVGEGLFIDANSAAWKEASKVNFVFNEPFYGEFISVRSERFSLPSSCAPGGSANVAQAPGRGFVVESDLADYDFNDTTFGYFDGTNFFFSTGLRICP